MAKLKLPFELEKPSSNEYVTRASEVGYGNSNVEEALNQRPLATNIPSLIDDSSADLSIADNNGNIVMDVNNGHVKTKNFDSSQNATTTKRGLMSASDKSQLAQNTDKLATIEEGAEVNDVETLDSSSEDFSIADASGNAVAVFEGGHVKTKNFDSKNVKLPSITTIDDENFLIFS